MSDFQLVSAFVNLAGDRDNVVVKGATEAITFPEALVLRAIHGGDEHVYDLVVVGSVQRSMAEEYERLQNIYGSIVQKVFPKIGNMATLPTGDEALPTQEEVDAAKKAAADAREAVRAKAPKKKKAADADADAPDAPLPSLADLPE